MGKRPIAGIGLTAFFGDGANDWGGDMDNNLRKLSVLTQSRAQRLGGALPTVPPEGEHPIYISTGGENSHSISVYDGGEWIHYEPEAGWRTYIIDRNEWYCFDGTDWLPEGGEVPEGLAPIKILASGQSNMALIVNEPETSIEYAPNLHYWNFNGWENELGTAFRTPLSTESSTAMVTANEIAKANPDRQVYVVNVSFGNTPISAWVNNTPIAARTTLVNNVEAARTAAGLSGEFDYFLWWQGEADADTNQQTSYVSNFQQFMTVMDSYEWFNSNTIRKIIYGVTDAPRLQWPNYNLINRVLQVVTAIYSSTAVFVPSGALPEPRFWGEDEGGAPNVHMSAIGYETLAKMSYVASTKGGTLVGQYFGEDPLSESLIIKGRGIVFPDGPFEESLPFRDGDGRSRLSTAKMDYLDTATIVGTETVGWGNISRNSTWRARLGDLIILNVSMAWTEHNGAGQARCGCMPVQNASGTDIPVLVAGDMGQTGILSAVWKLWTNEVHFYDSGSAHADKALDIPVQGNFNVIATGFIAG